MTFTASAVERVSACPASAILPQHRTTSAYADTGNEGHAALCAYAKARRVAADYEPPLEWQGLCEAVGAIEGDLHAEVAMAINVATLEARVLGYDIGRNYNLREFEIAGTADLVAVTPTHVIVIDAKTGWGDVTRPARNGQLRTLGLMACRAFGRERAHVAILHCHEGDTDPRWQWAELDELDLDETAFQLERTFRAISLAASRAQAGRSPDVTEGPWCRYCPAKTSCPAKIGLAIQVAEGRVIDGSIVELTPERAGIAWRRARAMKQLIEQVEDAVKVCLDEHGEIPLPDGKVLRRVMKDGNEKLDGDAVWQVLADTVGRELADKCVTRTATKKRLGEMLRHDLGRAGAATEREVLEEVRRRGGAAKGRESRIVEVDR